MSGDTQSRHCLWLMLVVSLAHIADAGSGGVGHSRRVSSVLPDTMVFPSGLNATLDDRPGACRGAAAGSAARQLTGRRRRAD